MAMDPDLYHHDRHVRDPRIVRSNVAAQLAQAGYTAPRSIAAKHETAQYQSEREPKGFGCEARRFDSEMGETDRPGPGAYRQAGSLDSHLEPSIGRGGFGAMVSKGARFKHRMKYTGPGPADYTLVALRVSADFNRAAATASFQATGSHLRNSSDSLGPGPAAYSTQATHLGERLGLDNAAGARSAFLARPHQLELKGNTESPPPNAYTLANLWDSKPYRGAGGSQASAPCFSPRAFSLHSAPQQSSVALVELTSQRRNVDTGPGPGAYETEYSSIHGAVAKGASKMSAAFTPLLGLPTRPVLAPGPGTYTYDSDGGGAPRRRISAPFVSRTAGHAEVQNTQVSDAPGPAYYPGNLLPGRKSFHLNVAERYMPRVC